MQALQIVKIEKKIIQSTQRSKTAKIVNYKHATHALAYTFKAGRRQIYVCSGSAYIPLL